MNPRPFAWLAGALLVLIGVAGFVPPLVDSSADPLRVAAGVGHAQLFGLLPVSALLNLIHFGLGVWGLYAGRTLGRSVFYARRMSIAAGLLTLAGLIPGPDVLWGTAPLYGNNVLLHGLLTLSAALFGWLYRKAPALAASGGSPVSQDWSPDD